MNPELQEFLYNTLSQLIAGVPIGTILSLVVYYALNKVKMKTAEFPTRASALEQQMKQFREEAIKFNESIKKEVISIVSVELQKFNKKAEEYQAIIEGYRQELEVANKQNQVVIAQNEITLDVLKIFIGENKSAVISGIAKNVLEKMKNYKEHAYLAQEIVDSYPEIKDKIMFLVENYPDALLNRLLEVPVEAMEDMVNKYEAEKSQG